MADTEAKAEPTPTPEQLQKEARMLDLRDDIAAMCDRWDDLIKTPYHVTTCKDVSRHLEAALDEIDDQMGWDDD